MKGLADYANKDECGLKFKAKFIDGLSDEPSDAMNLGNWFEFICTGQLPRTGEVPEPKRLKSGKLAVDYIRMEVQSDNYTNLMKHHKFEVIETGYVFNKDADSTGIADIIARKDGKTCIVDIKSSGLLDDKWNEFGWNLDALVYKDKLLIQAVHYKYLARKEWGEDADFYFAVFSTKNKHDALLLKINVDEDRMINHEIDIANAKIRVEEGLKNGFKAYPTYRGCTKCFLRESCSEALKTPEINEIYYQL